MSKFFRRYLTCSTDSSDTHFYRETLFFYEKAFQIAQADLARTQSAYKATPTLENLQKAVLTELQVISTILEKERQDSINDLHNVILFQGYRHGITDKHNDALEAWVARINSPIKSDGQTYNMYCRESYTIPETLKDFYDGKAKENLENGIQELERQNERAALFDTIMSQETVIKIGEILEDEELSLPEKEAACLAQIAKISREVEIKFDESRLEEIDLWGEEIASGYQEEEEEIDGRWTEKLRHCGRHTEEEHTEQPDPSFSWVSDLEKRHTGNEWEK